MTGSVTNRGGVRFEYRPDVPADVAWRAAMRGHDGYGPTAKDAGRALQDAIERELRVAQEGVGHLDGKP